MKMRLLYVAVALLVGASAQTLENPSVIRFSPTGPAGWAKAGRDGVRTHVYYESKGPGNARAGIWEGAKAVSKDIRYDTAQFLYFLQGSVILTDKKSSRQDTFKTGDAVVIARGSELVWKQTELARAYFVDFEREVPPNAKAPEQPPTFIRMQIDGPPDEGLKPSAADGGLVKSYRYYAGADRSSASVWDTAPRTVTYKEPKYSQLMVLLRGSVTLQMEDGRREEFKAGDAMLQVRGLNYTAEFQALRKYFVLFDQDPAGGRSSSQP